MTTMQEQEISTGRVHVGPAPWPHSKFRMTTDQLRQKVKKTQIPVEVTAGRLNTYCDFVERHGEWTAPAALAEGVPDYRLVESSAYIHREKIPRHYWRAGWGRQEPKVQPPENKRVALVESSIIALSREVKQLVVANGKLADILEDLRSAPKDVSPPEDRFERAEHRLQVLDEDLNHETARIDDAHGRINQLEAEFINHALKQRGPMSRFEKVRRALLHRVAYLFRGR